MKTRIATLAAVASAALTLVPALSQAGGFQPRYTPPAPAPGYHAAQPVYVPTTVASYGTDDRQDRERREADCATWERSQWEQFNRREAEARNRYTSRWGRDARRVAQFDARQARERSNFQKRIERERHERLEGRGHNRA